MRRRSVRLVVMASVLAALLVPTAAFAREQQPRDPNPVKRIVGKFLKQIRVPVILNDYPVPPKP